MKVSFIVIDGNGGVFTRGIVEGGATAVFKSLICAAQSGELSLQSVTDVFNLHMLDSHTPTELADWIVKTWEADEDEEATSALGLDGVSDDPINYIRRLCSFLEGPADTFMEEVAENQTSIFLKLQ